MNKNYDESSQFKASLDSIDKWINEARTDVYIYTELTREGQMTLSYNHFQCYLTEYKNKDIRKIKNNFFKIYDKSIKSEAVISSEDEIRIQILERVDFARKK